MNRLQMTKRALLSYVNAVKFIWSELAYPLIIIGKKFMNLRDYKIYGNSVQDGTPTPEAPIEVQSVGELVTEGEHAGKYKIPVNVRGKNLFDMLVRTVNNATEISYENGIQYCRGNAGNAYAVSGGQLRLKFPTIPANKKITISFYGTCIERGAYKDVYTQFWVGYDYSYHEEMRRIIWHGITGEKRKYVWTFTTTMDVNSFEMRLANSKWAIELNTFQIEIGDTATPYEPYIEPQTFNIYLDEPLRKIGDYADCIDFEKGVVVRKIQKKVYKGTEWWQYDEVINKNGFHHYFDNKNITTSLASDKKHVISNRLPSVTWGYLWNNYYKSSGATDLRVGVTLTYAINDKLIYVRITPYSTLPTVGDWKAQLVTWYEEGNPFTVWYVIPTEEEPIELPKLPQFKGTTIYEVGTYVEPSGMEVKYC